MIKLYNVFKDYFLYIHMKAKIEQIINNIDRKISDADASKKAIPKAAQEHLIFFKLLLKDGLISGKPLINVLKDAILYIENIKIQSVKGTFFSKGSTITMKNLLGKSTYLSNREAQSPLITRSAIHNTMLTDQDTLNFFKTIYEDLGSVYPINGWNYTYPLDDGEVFNQAIGEWQVAMIPINPVQHYNAYMDFKRNFTLEGKKEEDDDAITQALSALIAKTDYTDTQKENVMRWIQENGGQELNRFVDKLFEFKEFTGELTALAETDSSLNDWSVENGRMVFSYECCIYSYIDENGHIRKNSESGHIVESGGQDRSLPLLWICAKIELDVSDKQVIPKVTALNVSSFTSELRRPDAQNYTLTNTIK